MNKISKFIGISDAIAQIEDGDSIMLGGFGVPGTPFCLIEELVRQGQKNLVIIKNDANEIDMGVDWLLASGQVSKLITSHIGLNSRAVKMMNDGELEIEFVAQGILAERIRAAGAGLMAFATDISLDTDLAKGKTKIKIGGKCCILEHALKADFAFVHAHKSDDLGNLVYKASARNFNPLIAMAANFTIVEAETIVAAGQIDPDHVHTPGPFVDNIVALPQNLPEVYHVVKR